MARSHPRYLVDESGRKISVVLAINEYRQLMEDLQDLGLIAERKDEPAEPLDEVKKDFNHAKELFSNNLKTRLSQMDHPSTGSGRTDWKNLYVRGDPDVIGANHLLR